MAFKKGLHEKKVKALQESITLKDVDIVAEKYGISKKTIESDFGKLMGSIDTAIQKKKPGPKVKKSNVVKLIPKKPKKAESPKSPKEKLSCDKCGSTNTSKNGTYTVVNWLIKMITLILPFLNLNVYKVIQKYICNDCKASVQGKDRDENTYIRQTIKMQIARLICILRFKEGLSIRGISYIIKTIFGMNGSIGYITQLCGKVGEQAKKKLDEINKCNQKEAKMMIFDETFPKTKTSGTTNLGVVVDEYGLIRKVQAIVKKGEI
jgi:hypothetical protein